MNIEQLNKLLFQDVNILSEIANGKSSDVVLNKICHHFEAVSGLNDIQCAIFEVIQNNLFTVASPNENIQVLDELDKTPLSHFGYQSTKVENTINGAVNHCSFEIENPEAAQISKNNVLYTVDTPLVDQNELIGLLVIFSKEKLFVSPRQIEFIRFYSQIVTAVLVAERLHQKTELEYDSLKKSNEKFQAFVKVMPDLALIIDESGVYEDVHGSPSNLVYISATEIINKNVNDIFPADDAKKIMGVITQALKTDETQEYEYSIEGESGVSIFEGRITPIHYNVDETESAKHVLWMARDVTAAKKIQKKVKELAYFDPLTHLPNRRMFNERLELAVTSKAVSNEFGAILFLDLDEFKRINDSLGHSAGDRLLIDVSERLRNSLRKSDVLSRIGGDEFVILVESAGRNIEQAQVEMAMVAKKVQDAFQEKFQIEELVFQVSCSIGICIIDGTTDAQNVMKFADTAMYNSKRKGGNNYSYYDPKQQTLLERQLTFESEIATAIENGDFCAYFQPQIGCNDQVTGAEALIRWIHPTKGMIPPDEFISIAEQFGLIQSLQDIVLEEICKLLKNLERSGDIGPEFKVSINISHSQFRSSNFKESLEATINRYNVPASRITLEITESMLSHDIAKTVQQMNEIADTGFSFSIDDFGTGYSNLSNLHAFPVNELKIDKSFVDRMLDSSGLSIVETIISLAKNLDMHVVAEGVESDKQATLLKERDIDVLQGYHFSKPLPFDDYLKWHKDYLAQG
ncbi:EAL domain-containing protein [Psychrosphaera sp.]|nr:EAL domain-containing protein [Psychrosphaera sp.]